MCPQMGRVCERERDRMCVSEMLALKNWAKQLVLEFPSLYHPLLSVCMCAQMGRVCVCVRERERQAVCA